LLVTKFADALTGLCLFCVPLLFAVVGISIAGAGVGGAGGNGAVRNGAVRNGAGNGAVRNGAGGTGAADTELSFLIETDGEIACACFSAEPIKIGL